MVPGGPREGPGLGPGPSLYSNQPIRKTFVSIPFSSHLLQTRVQRPYRSRRDQWNLKGKGNPPNSPEGHYNQVCCPHTLVKWIVLSTPHSCFWSSLQDQLSPGWLQVCCQRSGPSAVCGLSSGLSPCSREVLSVISQGHGDQSPGGNSEQTMATGPN